MSEALQAPITRRRLLRGSLALAAGAGAIALVGCGSDEETPAATSTAPAATPATPSTPLTPEATPRPLAWRQVAGSGPSARRDHSLTLNPDDGRIYAFAGRARGIASNDLWAFDPATSAWSEVAVTGAKPDVRFGHNAFYDRAKKRLVIALGQADGSTFFDDVWAFDPATAAWTDIGAASPEKPEVRYGAGGAHDEAGNRLLVSHGFTDQGRFDDTWVFDLSADRWTKIATSGAVPVKRCLTRCLWRPDAQSMLLYGGQTDDNPFLGDVWSLDAEKRAWTEQKPMPAPGARNLYGATLDATGARWYVTGGNTPDGPASDTWVYAVAMDAWTKLEAATPPPARDSSDAAVAGSALYIFGGHDGTSEIADTWALDLA